MNGVFNHPDFDGHERVVFCRDQARGLSAIIALHSTRLGPALGGCRMYPYASDDEALTDVLRLSRGMSYKAAMAGLALGGGKSVIIGDPRGDKSEALFEAMGEFVQGLGGDYLVAEDSGTTVEDLRLMARRSQFVTGVKDKLAQDGRMRSGDPSWATAYGVYLGIEAAVQARLGRASLDGVRVAIQGVGAVGAKLADRLAGAGARLWVADTQAEAARRVAEATGAETVPVEQIAGLDVDVFAPCALGGAITDETIARLRAVVVAGSANNQLAQPGHDRALHERGVLYAPDYVINAGGLIDVAEEHGVVPQGQTPARLERLAGTLQGVFERARREDRPTGEVADQIAEERLLGGAGDTGWQSTG